MYRCQKQQFPLQTLPCSSSSFKPRHRPLPSSPQISQMFYSTYTGQYISKVNGDNAKYQLLENSWVPPKDYLFPYSVNVKGGKQIRHCVGHQH